MRRLLLISCLSLILAPLAACDSDTSAYPNAGVVTLGPEQGIDFRTGQLQDPGNFANSDLFATPNGTSLKLATGGPSPTVNRPVNWFRTSGGIHETFASLAEVPVERPTDEMTDSLVNPRVGNAFVVETHAGSHVRGWLEASDGRGITIQWDRVD